MTDPASLRRASEAAITQAGGRVNPELPVLDAGAISPRDSAEVARRALALNVLARVAFGWPRDVARQWLDRHGLATALQPDERELLSRPQEVSAADRWLCLHVESLGMAAWLGGLASAELQPWDALPDATAALFPDPFKDESPAAFLAAFRLRDRADLHRMADLYYRAHWHARQCERDRTPNDTIPYAPTQFRRLMLEWAAHANVDWHDTDLGT